MTSGPLRFAGFLLDPDNRQLSRDGRRIAINARYLDALTLLVSQAGMLVTKDQFHDQVWRGVPVTDEALTQCIRTLRRALGDDAADPRLIETVPKHGYRFVAPVERVAPTAAVGRSAALGVGIGRAGQQVIFTGLAGTMGGALAGMVGGLAYGALAASGSQGGSMLSTVAVMLVLTTVLAAMGGAGVAFGSALAVWLRPAGWVAPTIGGATGGMSVGAAAQLIGVDAFSLLFGAGPAAMTGAGEGVVLGAAGGLCHRLVRATTRRWSLAVLMAICGTIGAAAGVAVSLAGGQLLGGSLVLLTERFPDATLRLGLPGGAMRGSVMLCVVSGLEAMLFCAGLAAAFAGVERRFASSSTRAMREPIGNKPTDS